MMMITSGDDGYDDHSDDNDCNGDDDGNNIW